MNNSSKLKLMFVVASRPNFMKVAPLVKEAQTQGIKFSIFYTEQHKSELMTGIFAKELGLPDADYNLGLKSKVKGTSKLRKGFALINSFNKARKIIRKDNPSCVVVVGDVISSAYIALVTRSLSLPIAHVEAGLRSFNNKMPEERARKIIDKFSNFLFTPEKLASNNLVKEGKNPKNIFLVGNIMIDSLINNIKEAEKMEQFKKIGLKKQGYAVLTFHRHENITKRERIKKLLGILDNLSKKIPVVYPLHPATKRQLIKFGLLEEIKSIKNVKLIDPLGYKEMLNLVLNSKFVMTDSGGLQEETTYLGVPCLTLRTETERPVTVEVGTNTIVNLDKNKINSKIGEILEHKYKKGKIPELWDGKTAKRIIEILKNENNTNI